MKTLESQMILINLVINVLNEELKDIKFYECEGIDTICAYSLEQAIKHYEKECSIDVVKEGYTFYEIDPTGLKRTDIETGKRKSYLTALAEDLNLGATIPYTFASTEY